MVFRFVRAFLSLPRINTSHRAHQRQSEKPFRMGNSSATECCTYENNEAKAMHVLLLLIWFALIFLIISLCRSPPSAAPSAPFGRRLFSSLRFPPHSLCVHIHLIRFHGEIRAARTDFLSESLRPFVVRSNGERQKCFVCIIMRRTSEHIQTFLACAPRPRHDTFRLSARFGRPASQLHRTAARANETHRDARRSIPSLYYYTTHKSPIPNILGR